MAQSLLSSKRFHNLFFVGFPEVAVCFETCSFVSPMMLATVGIVAP